MKAMNQNSETKIEIFNLFFLQGKKTNLEVENTSKRMIFVKKSPNVSRRPGI